MKTIATHLVVCTLTSVLCASSSASAQTQTPDGTDLVQRFGAADKNGDGKLTLEEAKIGMPRVAKAFDRIDKEKKGYITLEQIKAMMARG